MQSPGNIYGNINPVFGAQSIHDVELSHVLQVGSHNVHYLVVIL